MNTVSKYRIVLFQDGVNGVIGQHVMFHVTPDCSIDTGVV